VSSLPSVFKSGVGWSLRRVQTKLLGAVYWALYGTLPDDLIDDPQDYVVLPGQPWLDGFASADGIVSGRSVYRFAG
jgi:hypothetical protein